MGNGRRSRLPPTSATAALPQALAARTFTREVTARTLPPARRRFLNEAYKYLGVPYVWGGNTYGGIDCSGFVKNVYGALGFPLPRLGSDQMAYGVPVPVDQLQPGDRLYFTPRTERLGVHHTGFYVGNGYFIHASSGKHQVTVSHLSESYYRKNFVCARR